MKKRIFVLLITVIMLLSAVPIISLPVSASATYDANAALSYAANHWNDGVGLCAEFVSNCIKAGGCSAWSAGATTLMKLLKQTNMGTVYDITSSFSNGYVKMSDCEQFLSPGDAVFYHCNYCEDGLAYNVHVVLCNGMDSSGYMKAYSHNSANGGINKYSYKNCGYCHSPIDAIYVYHFSGTGGTPTPTPTPNYHECSNCVEVSKGASVTNVSSVLNVRSGPGTSYEKIFELTNGTGLVISVECNGWYFVTDAGGSSGWVSSDYVEINSQETHSHNYTDWNYEIAPPHREYMSCSCGAYQYTGENYFDEAHYVSYYAVHPHYEVKVCNVCGWDHVEATGGTRYVDSCTTCNPPMADIPTLNSVTVSGQSVSVNWSASKNAKSYDVYLLASPWGWGDIKYSKTGLTSTSYTFTGVAFGYYKAFVIARPQSDNQKQSNWINFTITSEIPKPALKNMKTSYFTDEDVCFTWNPTQNTTHYNIYIDKYDGNSYKRLENIHYAENGLVRKFDEGEYRVCLQSTNSNGYMPDGSTWLYTDGDFVYFSIDVPTYTVKFDGNGGIGAPDNLTKSHNIDLTISTAKPTLAGYTFKHWQGDDGIVYNPGDTFSGNYDLCLTAHYSQNVPERPTIYLEKNEFFENETITVTWNSCNFATEYDFVVLDADGNYEYTRWGLAENTRSHSFTLKAGVYTIQVAAVNKELQNAGGSNYYWYSLPISIIVLESPIIEGAPTITVETTEAKAGETFDVTLTIEENTGIAGMVLKMQYSDALTLTNISTGDALSGLTFTAPGKLSSKILNLTFDGQDADKTNGTFLVFTFTVNENAEAGDYPITVTYNKGDVYDDNLEDISLNIFNGGVTIPAYTPGDVNDDGTINTKDLTLIRRHIAGGYSISLEEAAANVNADGTINTKDLTLIRRYIAGGYSVELK